MDPLATIRASAAREYVLDRLANRFRGEGRPHVGPMQERYLAALRETNVDGISEHYDWHRAMVREWHAAREYARAMSATLTVLDFIDQSRDRDGNTGD